jgi:hypothetical protein
MFRNRDVWYFLDVKPRSYSWSCLGRQPQNDLVSHLALFPCCGEQTRLSISGHDFAMGLLNVRNISLKRVFAQGLPHKRLIKSAAFLSHSRLETYIASHEPANFDFASILKPACCNQTMIHSLVNMMTCASPAEWVCDEHKSDNI